MKMEMETENVRTSASSEALTICKIGLSSLHHHSATPPSFPSASEMTYIVSGGALNSTHSLRLFSILQNASNPPTLSLGPDLQRILSFSYVCRKFLISLL